MKKQHRLCRITTIVTVGTSLLMILFLGFILFRGRNAVFEQRRDVSFSVLSCGTPEIVNAPEAPQGFYKEYLLSISDLTDHDSYFAFYSLHHYVNIFLDSELVYSLQPPETGQIGKTPGCNWNIIRLYREDADKTLKIQLFPVYKSFHNWEPEFQYGSYYGIYVNLLKELLPQFILSSMTFFIGIVLLCISLYNHFYLHRFASLARLGIFSVLMGLWVLCDMPLAPFHLPQQSIFLFYTSVAILMLGFVPLINFMTPRLNERSQRILNAAALMTAAVALAQLLLQLSGRADLRETLLATHIVIAVDSLCILGNVLYEHRLNPANKSLLYSRHLYILCVIGIMLDLLAFALRGSSVGLIYALVSFLLYIIFTSVLLLLDYAEHIRQVKDQEIALMENRLAVTLSQIQPHFIYNSLGAIRELCRQDPEEARDAIGAFTAYLRGNMDSLRSSSPIHFSKELSHTKTYLQLEQLRFGDSLKIVFDLGETDFFLPPLTVQPLVENAVKHGVCCREEGGTVTLSTRRQGEHIVICVQDDGVGFDAGAEITAEHVGISNVRSRLRQQANGTLHIVSRPNCGTTATITLPL